MLTKFTHYTVLHIPPDWLKVIHTIVYMHSKQFGPSSNGSELKESLIVNKLAKKQ